MLIPVEASKFTYVGFQAGVIFSERHGEHWLEPTKESHSTEGGRQHIVFKRTAVVPESRKKKRKKKKKHEKNCGTRGKIGFFS